jgi:hypothetical protein
MDQLLYKTNPSVAPPEPLSGSKDQHGRICQGSTGKSEVSLISQAGLSATGSSGAPQSDAAAREAKTLIGDAGVEVGTLEERIEGERQSLLKNSWLSATGHKRPGMNPGLPLFGCENHSRHPPGMPAEAKAGLP